MRDGLLGLHPTDFDVATDAAPMRVRSLFPRASEVGAAFGVMLVYVSGDIIAGEGLDQGGPSVNVEVATFRADGPYSDARRPDTIRFSDAQSDAERRDFTINALFLDPLDAPGPGEPGLELLGDLKGRVIDYVGGLNDLRDRVLRAVGDPDRRLQEDHLRALRAVRFASRLAFRLDAGTAEAIRRHAAELRGVSRERIGEELRRMLAHPTRGQALGMLQELGLDAPVLLAENRRAPLLRSGKLPADAEPTVVLCAWMLDRAGSAGQAWLSDLDARSATSLIRQALCLSNQETEELDEAFACVRGLLTSWESGTVAYRKRLTARDLCASALEIVRATHAELAKRIDGDVRSLMDDGVGINPPVWVTGDDLIADGFVPGPNFRRILDSVRDAQLEGRIGTKEAGMELARKLNV